MYKILKCTNRRLIGAYFDVDSGNHVVLDSGIYAISKIYNLPSGVIVFNLTNLIIHAEAV